MNVKMMSVCLACAGALLAGCGNSREKNAAAAAETEKTEIVGDDKDEHGCIASAGYTWSEVQKDCIRLWEKGVRLASVDDAENTLFIVFSPDSTQVELFFSEADAPNEILDRRSLPAGGQWERNLPGDMPGIWKMTIRRTCAWRMASGL